MKFWALLLPFKLLQICNFALLVKLVAVCGLGAVHRSNDIVQSAILCAV